MSDFGWALERLKEGYRVARTGWNGKGMWLLLIPATNYAAASLAVQGTPIMAGKLVQTLGEPLDLLPWIGMKTADAKFVPWLCSQTDMLADDWEAVQL